MDHSASPSIIASSFNMSANASVIWAAHAKLHHAALMSASGVVGPIEIDVSDPVSVDEDSDVKTEKGQKLLPLTSTELLAYLRELDEVSKRLQQLAVELGEENPALAWLAKLIAAYLVIQAINALLN